MNTRLLCVVITGLSLTVAAIAAEQEAAPAAKEQPPAAVATPQAAAATAPVQAEPTEAEMKEAVQHNLDNINAMMRQPVTATSSSSSTRANPYMYSPYWHYYHAYYYRNNSKESDYANWTDVARSAAATTRIEITSFKKVRCTPAPDQGGFMGEYVAELNVKGNNPAAQAVMQTSGKKMQGVFSRGDKGWIFGETKSDSK